MKKIKSIPSPVTLEHNGKTYRGSYIVEKGTISVSAMGRIKSTQLGSSPPENLARIILREIIDSEGPSTT